MRQDFLFHALIAYTLPHILLFPLLPVNVFSIQALGDSQSCSASSGCESEPIPDVLEPSSNLQLGTIDFGLAQSRNLRGTGRKNRRNRKTVEEGSNNVNFKKEESTSSFLAEAESNEFEDTGGSFLEEESNPRSWMPAITSFIRSAVSRSRNGNPVNSLFKGKLDDVKKLEERKPMSDQMAA